MLKTIFTVFLTIFFAELGDKTQLAALVMSARSSWIAVFLGAMLAFAATTLIAIALGNLLKEFNLEKWVSPIGGVIFIVLGVLMLLKKI
jgi:putative Ca2+/H+ antiporter (TMEM165/GDT1 family)